MTTTIHDLRGMCRASIRRLRSETGFSFGKAFNAYRLLERRLDTAKRAKRERMAANIGKPSKRARRRARVALASIGKLVDLVRVLGPFPVRIYVSDEADLPAPAQASEAEPSAMGLLGFRPQGVQVVIVRDLARGTGFVEYSDGSVKPIGKART